MTDHDIISLECIAEADLGAISPDVYRGALIKAMTAIKKLVEERDDMHDALTVAYLAGVKKCKARAEKAGADLAAARKALRYADEEKGISWIPEHETAIAAARAEVATEPDLKKAGVAAEDFLDENPTLLSEVGALLDGKSCETCNGLGFGLPSEPKQDTTCPTCGGGGFISMGNGMYPDCPDCNGTG